jgi:WD40 repeat protein
LTGGADRKLVLYDGKTYEKLGEKDNAHGGSIFGLDWISEEHFVTVSSDRLIKIWNTKFE